MIGLPSLPDLPDYKGLVSSGLDAAISFGGGLLINTLFGNYWGIFTEVGVPIMLVDNVLSLQYSNKSNVAQAQIEKGSFTSYNKVAEPYTAVVQVSKSSGGTLQRGAFLAELETLKNSTLQYYVITPEYVYKNASITGIDYAREAHDGATLIKVNIALQEIREVKAKYGFEEVLNPDDAAVEASGDKTAEVEANAEDTSGNALFDTMSDIGGSLWSGDITGAAGKAVRGIAGMAGYEPKNHASQMANQAASLP